MKEQNRCKLGVIASLRSGYLHTCPRKSRRDNLNFQKQNFVTLRGKIIVLAKLALLESLPRSVCRPAGCNELVHITITVPTVGFFKYVSQYVHHFQHRVFANQGTSRRYDRGNVRSFRNWTCRTMNRGDRGDRT